MTVLVLRSGAFDSCGHADDRDMTPTGQLVPPATSAGTFNPLLQTTTSVRLKRNRASPMNSRFDVPRNRSQHQQFITERYAEGRSRASWLRQTEAYLKDMGM